MGINADVSTLTTIPVSAIERLKEKEQMCILHKFFENEKSGEPVTFADVGIGTVYIKHEGNELRYKFIPSKMFEENLIKVSQTKQSPLVEGVEEALRERIVNTYKDLF